MRMMRFHFVCACVVVSSLLLSGRLLAQAQSADTDATVTSVVVNPSPPKTKLEAAATAKGVLIVGGFTEVGTVAADDGSGAKVTAVEFTNSATQEKQYGLIVTLHQTQGNRTAKSFIDDDELDSLLSNLQAMQKLDHTATQLGDFTGRLQTRGDLEVGNVASDGAREMVLRGVQIERASGEITWATVHEPLSRLGDLIQCMESGKQTIDKVKANH